MLMSVFRRRCREQESKPSALSMQRMLSNPCLLFSGMVAEPHPSDLLAYSQALACRERHRNRWEQ
jgi:hypothetical protein